jgi:hypothetical protein
MRMGMGGSWALVEGNETLMKGLSRVMMGWEEPLSESYISRCGQ